MATRIRRIAKRNSGEALAVRKLPRQERSRMTVDAIVEAATRILEEHGLEGYTTNRVADRAGISIGSFYQYFPNKDALTAELSRRRHDELVEALRTSVRRHSPTSLRGALRAVVSVAVEGQRHRPGGARAVDYEEARLGLRDDGGLAGAVEATLRPFTAGTASDSTVAADVTAIARALIDRAAPACLEDERWRERLVHAVTAYVRSAKPRYDRRRAAHARSAV